MNVKSSNNPQVLETLRELPTWRAGVAQSTTYRVLKKFTEECISDHGITMMQWFIIGTIHDAGPSGIGVTELSKAVDTNVPYITNTLNLLEHKHIIDRDTREGDNRSKIVRISPSFEPQIEEIEHDLRVRMRNSIYQNVTPQELLTYINVLHKLNSTFTDN